MGTTLGELNVTQPCAICNDEGWVCEVHPQNAWSLGCCTGAGEPCVCQPVSAEEINALSERVRAYIHGLCMGYDPRGDVRRQVIELHIMRETAEALAIKNGRYRQIINRLLRAHIPKP